MKVGLFAAFVTPDCSPEVVTAAAIEAEDRGYDSFWVGEHLAFFDSYTPAYPGSEDGRIPIAADQGMPDPLLLLSWAAAVTKRVRLATGICLLPQRSLPYTAKEVATLDWLSGGRVDFGVGVGWQREEFDAAGVPWERRGARTDEYLDALVELWTKDPSSFDGDFVRFAPARMHPKPARSPYPRLVIGGHAEATLARTARIGDGWFGWYLDPESTAAKVARLAELVEAAGRTTSEIEVTVQTHPARFGPAEIGPYRDAGVDQLTIMVRPSTVEHLRRAMDKLQPLADAIRAA
ncbi:MAG: LLM class F420-dependent oxidoreductase [Acidimicrobiia bacterium]|nr:LLM class F420-dependent oxidoreductase [Acidimicrobiia bacterium]